MANEKPAEVTNAIQGIRADYMRFISPVTVTPTPDAPASASDGCLSQKRLRLSEGVRSMDNPPQPGKRFKRTY
jgi:hypothetical protein